MAAACSRRPGARPVNVARVTAVHPLGGALDDRPHAPSDRTPASRDTWILICVLLAPAVVVPLLVPLYDSDDPTLFGFPFYYWFQLAMIPAAVVLT